MCDCEERNSRLQSRGSIMSGLALEYEEESKAKYESDKKIEHYSDEMKEIEIYIKTIVNNEKTDDGKAKFTNQEQRDIAAFKFLSEHKAYQEYKKQKEEELDMSERSKLKLDILKIRLKVAESHLKIEELWRY